MGGQRRSSRCAHLRVGQVAVAEGGAITELDRLTDDRGPGLEIEAAGDAGGLPLGADGLGRRCRLVADLGFRATELLPVAHVEPNDAAEAALEGDVAVQRVAAAQVDALERALHELVSGGISRQAHGVGHMQIGRRSDLHVAVSHAHEVDLVVGHARRLEGSQHLILCAEILRLPISDVVEIGRAHV